MIYLDHAAATPVIPKAKQAMEDYFSEQFFNPSSPYLPAKHVRDNYEFAKNTIAHTIGAKGVDLIITAGATESINLAFTAVLSAVRKKTAVARQNGINNAEKVSKMPNTTEILILSTEHASVRAVAQHYATEVGARLIEVNVDKNGLIDLKDFQNKLSGRTVFVSVSLANNELGTIQPLAEIAEIIRKERERRLKDVLDARGSAGYIKDSARDVKNNAGNTRPLPLIFHSDASQALNLIDISVARLGVDLLTINSAKIGGPKGVGALYVSHEVELRPVIYGGGQELGLRSGTENVPGVIGFAAAAEEAKSHVMGNRKKYQKYVEILKSELLKCKLEPVFLGNPKHQLANFCPVSFPGIDAERIIYLLEEKQVYLSTGAACSANKGTVSKVLKAIKLTDAEIFGSLRISLGMLNTEENVHEAGKLIVEAVEKEFLRCRK